MMNYGVRSMVAPLRTVAMRRPVNMSSADLRRWHYAFELDDQRIDAQYERFVSLLRASGCDIAWIADEQSDLHDSIFTYDPSFMLGEGALLLRPGKQLRIGEVELHRRFYERAGIPTVGQVCEPGTIEGGDCLYLDSSTIAVGRGFRTNDAGIRQFEAIVEPLGYSVEVYDLPCGDGPDACLHLLSLISPLDRDLALVHRPLLPVALWERLRDTGHTLIDAPLEEFVASRGLTLNVLATAPRRVIAIDGYPETAAAMRDAGCSVEVFSADALCIPCEGGPTCLTRPIYRS